MSESHVTLNSFSLALSSIFFNLFLLNVNELIVHHRYVGAAITNSADGDGDRPEFDRNIDAINDCLQLTH